MARAGDPYENALAERVNGILKQELGLGSVFANHAMARRALEQAVWLYNERRPHLSLGYRKPGQVHATDRIAIRSRHHKTPKKVSTYFRT
jgi:putative transposase